MLFNQFDITIKNRIFFNLSGHMKIPYNELAKIIYPRYLESLSKE